MKPVEWVLYIIKCGTKPPEIGHIYFYYNGEFNSCQKDLWVVYEGLFFSWIMGVSVRKQKFVAIIFFPFTIKLVTCTKYGSVVQFLIYIMYKWYRIYKFSLLCLYRCSKNIFKKQNIWCAFLFIHHFVEILLTIFFVVIWTHQNLYIFNATNAVEWACNEPGIYVTVCTSIAICHVVSLLTSIVSLASDCFPWQSLALWNWMIASHFLFSFF